MASTAGPNGLRPVNLIGGQVYAGSTRMFSILNGYTTSIFYGDAVKIAADGTVQKDTGTNAMTPVGIFLGCGYTDPTLGYSIEKQYWAASTVATDAIAYVADDPDAVFQIQANGAVPLTATGGNAALVQTAGNTSTGNSLVSLNASSVNTTNTLPVRIIGFVQGPMSTVGDAFTDVLVIWNAGMHQYRNATGV